jgi:hypothetical protein
VKSWLIKNAVWIIIGLCLVSRLPQLLNTNILIDQDECIMGLMAKHFAEGKTIPFFFYGQNYGFSFVEVVFIRIFYFFFGVTDTAIRLSMLSLWTIGVVFHYKTLKNLSTPTDFFKQWLAFLLTLVFIFCPVWAVWSLKARGGYLTAFTLFSVVTYLISGQKQTKTPHLFALLGLILVLIYQAQPLWLAGLAPILSYFLYQNRQNNLLAASPFLILGIGLTAAFFFYIKMGLPNYWSPKVLSLRDFSFAPIYKYIYWNFTGSYIYEFVSPPFITQILSIIFTLLLTIVLGFGGFWAIKKENKNPLFYIFCLSVLATLFYKLIIKDESPRYLLPLYGGASCLFYTFFEDSVYKKAIQNTAYTLIVLGVFSLYSFRKMDYEYAPKSVVLATIKQLQNQNTPYVFCRGGALQWSLMFYSKEEIIARCLGNTDRCPTYIERVNTALENTPRKTAMIGFYQSEDSTLVPITPIARQYYIYSEPKKAFLQQHGFQF